jgi:hypothetical protein
MKSIRIARPNTDEYNPAFGPYIRRVEDIEDARQMLAFQQERVVRLLEPLGDAAAAYRYAPDKWSIKEMIGHLSDSERIFTYRLLRVGRGDSTPLPPFDENAYVPAAQSDLRLLSDLVEEWRAIRLATLALVRGMPDEAWALRGTASNHPISARALLYIIVGHVDHHLAVLSERYGLPA